MSASAASTVLDPGPIGTACRRTRSGAFTTSTSRCSRRVSSALHVPCSSRVSPDASGEPGGTSSPCRWIARTIRSPLSVTMPGKKRCADQRRARRDQHFGKAGIAVEQRYRRCRPPGVSSRKARPMSVASSAAWSAGPRMTRISPSRTVSSRVGLTARVLERDQCKVAAVCTERLTRAAVRSAGNRHERGTDARRSTAGTVRTTCVA